jgi:hypothetical protein
VCAESAPHGAGNTHSGLRFAAFTDILVKSYTVIPTTAGTIGSVFLARHCIPGTSTATHTLATLTAASVHASSTFALGSGDVLEVTTAGTDATARFAITAELLIEPGAEVTV